MTSEFKPFKNDHQAINVGPSDSLSIENDFQTIAIYGDISVSKGDEDAKKALQDVIDVLTKIKDAM